MRQLASTLHASGSFRLIEVYMSTSCSTCCGSVGARCTNLHFGRGTRSWLLAQKIETAPAAALLHCPALAGASSRHVSTASAALQFACPAILYTASSAAPSRESSHHSKIKHMMSAAFRYRHQVMAGWLEQPQLLRCWCALHCQLAVSQAKQNNN
jgi:hypothetical protein